MDVGPMARCPFSKSGRHEGAVLYPTENEGDLTWFCAACGSMRRVPAAGSLFAGTPLDDWPSEMTKETNDAQR